MSLWRHRSSRSQVCSSSTGKVREGMHRKVEYLRIMRKFMVQELQKSFCRIGLAAEHRAAYASKTYPALKILFGNLRPRVFQQRQGLFTAAGFRHRQRQFHGRGTSTGRLFRGLRGGICGKEAKNQKSNDWTREPGHKKGDRRSEAPAPLYSTGLQK